MRAIQESNIGRAAQESHLSKQSSRATQKSDPREQRQRAIQEGNLKTAASVADPICDQAFKTLETRVGGLSIAC